MRNSTRFLLVVIGLLFWVVSARAELPIVRFDRITPLGGEAGSTVTVDIAGNDIDEVKSLLFDHPSLKSEAIEGKDKQFRVVIGTDVPAGTYDAWLVGRYGVSNSRLFAVSRGLKDLLEVEPNNSVEKAQAAQVNMVVYGSSDSNDQDLYRVPLQQGERITVQCQAGKLDSMLDATLSLSSSSGAILTSNGDYHGRDSFLDFIAPTAGDYFITVHDLSFRGGHPYRLIISNRPQIENVSPRVVRIGSSTELTLLGRNLGAGANPSLLRVGDMALDERKIKVEPPTDIFDLRTFRFFDHPTDHSTLPTAATCTLVGFQVALGAGGQNVNREDVGSATAIMFTDQEITTETEPNNDRENPQVLTLPAVVSGRFDTMRDADWYEIKITEAGSYAVDCYCERIAGRADPFVVVVDDQGKRVSELDDYGHRMSAFDGHLRDPSGSVNLAANKTYRVLVQDRYGRGGPRYQYVLSLKKALPDFFVASIHSQSPGPGNLTVRRGSAAHVDLIVHQTGGFNGPVTVTAENLPAGLHAVPTTISSTNGPFVIWADADAPETVGFITLVATGKRGEETLKREVRPYVRVWSDTNMNSSRPMRQLPCAVRETAPYGMRLESPMAAVEAGKKMELKLKLDRHWTDFRNKVNILALGLPNNFKMSNTEVAEGQTELTLSIEVQNNVRPGDYTITVMGQAQVPFSKDPKATSRPNSLVSLPAIPATVQVIAAKMEKK